MKKITIFFALISFYTFGQTNPDKPLTNEIYTADPSAHVFDGKIYIYPSHDVEFGGIPDDSGNQYDMVDYHVLSMDKIGGEVTVHDVGRIRFDVHKKEGCVQEFIPQLLKNQTLL